MNEFELHLRALLDLPIPEINLISPAATRVIISEDEYQKFAFFGIHEALKIKNSKILIFGKPFAKKGRRMGVAIATGLDIEQARLRADKCASNIKISSSD